MYMTEKNVSTDTALPMEAIALIPHRPPMLFVDSLIDRSDNEAKATAVMPESGICFDPEYAFSEYFIEVVAQAMAMVNGYDAKVAGKKVQDGLLVGVDRFSFKGTAPAGAVLHVAIKKTMEFGAIKIIHGEIFCGETLLVEGDLKVWEAPDDAKDD
jgi:predicted hotdog family 3-hydroxylacyl-ACP dehydratase